MSMQETLEKAEKEVDAAMAAMVNGEPGEPIPSDLIPPEEPPVISEPPALEIDGGEPAPDVKAELEKARHRISVLEGMLEALDTKELQRRLSAVERERDEQRNAAEMLFAEVCQLRSAATSAPPVGEGVPSLTDEQEALYGDMIPVITTMVKKTLAEQGIDPAKLDKVEGVVREVSAVRRERVEDKRMAFFSSVDRLVPNREVIESDPEFKEFMFSRDWKTKRTNQELLVERANSLDVDGVVAFYNEFLKTSPQSGAAPAAEPTPDPREKFVSPGKSRPASPPSRKGDVTAVEYSRTMAKVQELQRKGKADEAESVLNDLLERMAKKV